MALASAAVAIVLNRRWAYGVAAILCGLDLLVVGMDWAGDDAVYIAAVREGCRVAPFVSIGLSSLLVVAMACLTFRTPRYGLVSFLLGRFD